MADDTKKSAQPAGSATGDDEDVVHFNLMEHAPEEQTLHVDLTDDEDEAKPVAGKKEDYDIPLEDEEPVSFSLAGDDLMSLFEKLQQTIDEETQSYLKRQKQHKLNIATEEEAMRQEKSAYEQKRKRMLEGLGNLQTKLTGGKGIK